MPNQRTRTGRGTSSTTDDVTRDAMLREEDDTMAGTEATGARQREYDKTADNDYWTSEGPGPKVMAADTVQGDSVSEKADEKLGEIMVIVIDVPTGRVAYVVISDGGNLVIGGKVFAVRWQAVTAETG